MKKLISTFVKYPFYANILIAAIILSGIIGLLSMKKSFFPERTPKHITVSVVYLGASPKEMEEGVTTRIEEAIRSIAGIKEINSTSSENFAIVRIETTGEYDLDETLAEVKNAVDGISSFPVDAERPIVYKERPTTFGAYLGLSGNVDLLTLKKFANQIEDDLLNSGVISQVNVRGYPPLEISVEVSEENLLRYNLSFEELMTVIRMNNQDISAGMIKSQDEEILIRSRSRSVDPNDIGNIVLRAMPDGSNLLIRNIAEVKMKFQDVANDFTMNGKQAVSFEIKKLPEEDLQKIADFLYEYTENFNNKHDAVYLEITYDFMTMLNARLNLLLRNGGMGFLLVILSLTIFLSFRLSLWVAAGIPAAFMAMFLVASLSGITINMISLFGMILVVGILVDDGIVIAENIYTHYEMGKRPKRAAIDGTMEVLPAVVTSVTTTMVAFAPLFFVEGRMEFMYEMAFVVVFSLGFSLLEALLILPAHVGSPHVLRAKKRAGRITNARKKIENLILFFRNKVYGKVLSFIIKWRWIIIFMPVSFIMITGGLFISELIPATFFPSIPFDSFTVNLAYKPGTGERKTREKIRAFDSLVWKVNNEISETESDTMPYISYSYARVGGAFNEGESGSHAGNVRVFFNDMENRELSSFEVAEKVRQKIGDIPDAEKFSVGGSNMWGYPISFSLLGKDLNQLEKAKAFTTTEMRKIKAVKDVVDNNAIGKQEVRLKLKPQAYFLGLNKAYIANQIRQGFYGGQVQRLQQGKDEIRVWVRYPKKDRLNIGKLESMKIKTPAGDYPLTELAYYNIVRGPVNIQRYNGSREVRINADLVDPYQAVPPVLAQIDTDILSKVVTKFPGIKVVVQGQAKSTDETEQEIFKYFGIAFMIIILILMIHFRSSLQAFIIILMIPLSWLGAVWGHGFETFLATIKGTPPIPVSMLSAWGMVALSGVIINDAVVFLSKFNSLVVEGNKVEDAVYNAGIARFRPILLTTITTSVGLYPIILEGSFQAQFLKPMAITLAYGVAVGTGFLLMFFPALILVLNDVKRFFYRSWKWIWTGEKVFVSPEEVETAMIHSKRVID